MLRKRETLGTAVFGAVLVSILCGAGTSHAEDYVYVSTWLNVNIPDDGAPNWVNQNDATSGAPAGATITRVVLNYKIVHTYVGDLRVQFTCYYDGQWHDYTLWDQAGGSADDIVVNGLELHAWDGGPPNNTWYLKAQDCFTADTGYIDYFDVWVYYTVPTDLRVASVNAPSGTYSPGDSFSVSNSTTNDGGDCSGYTIKFYASTNTTITTSDTEIASYSRGALASGATHSYNSTVTLPTSLAEDTYWIGARVTWTGGADTGYDATPITVAVPDLTITSMEINDSTAADQQFQPGQSVKLDFRGYNGGNATSLTSIRMKWWYGTSSYAKTNEISYGYLGIFNGLSPGEYEWETDASWPVPTTPGTYWLTAKIDDNNMQSDESNEGNNERTLRFLVVTPATITSHPSNRTVPDGGSATFSVTASGYPTPTYQWQRNSSNIPGATSPSYTVSPATMSDDGSRYRCIVTNSVGSDWSNTATLTVTPVPPAITQHPSAQVITEGQTASFSVSATGSSPLSYQWQRNGSPISGATSSSYTTPPTNIADSGGLYRCVVTNSAGTATSNQATLTVNAAQPVVLQHPQAQTVAVGDLASFSVSATSSVSMTYQWRRNGANMSGKTSSSYSVVADPVDDGASYDCVVTNSGYGNASTISNSAIITVFVPIPTIILPPFSQAVNVGNTATFTVAATGTPTLTYQWEINKGASWANVTGLDGSGGTTTVFQTVAATLAMNGYQYRCVVTNPGGDTNSSAANLAVSPPDTPVVITGPPSNQTVTKGQSATFSVVAEGSAPITYEWSKDGVPIPGATNPVYITPATVYADDGAVFSCTATNSFGSDSEIAVLTVNLDPALDEDGDGLTNGDEVSGSPPTDPINPDTDGDGLTDGAEVNTHFTDPTTADSDGDGYTDKEEVDAGSDPNNAGDMPPPPPPGGGGGCSASDTAGTFVWFLPLALAVFALRRRRAMA